MFQALLLLGNKTIAEDMQVGGLQGEDDNLMATIETMDLDEYMVDVTDGMERDLEIGDWGAVLKPLQEISSQGRQKDGEAHRGTLEGWLVGGETKGTLRHGDYGEVELKKRKPPDGEPQG